MTATGIFPKIDGDVYYAQDVHHAAGIISIKAGENITKGNIVYIKKNDGKIYISDTGTADDIRADGIALETVNADANCYVMTRGVYETTGLTANTAYYLGVAGAIGTTRNGVYVGMAISTTEIFINVIQDDRDAIGTIKFYDKSATGLPVQNITAFWVECNGQALSDAESPRNGQTMPDMNITQRIARGAATSGGTGGADSHTHSFTTTDTSDPAGSTYSFNSANNTTAAASTLPAYYEAVWITKIK